MVNGATKWDDIAHLREHLPDEITLTHLEDRALLALQGPEAAARAGAASCAGGRRRRSASCRRRRFDCRRAAPRRRPLRLHRRGRLRDLGRAPSRPSSSPDALCAEPEVKPIGLGARDSLRLEAGLPLYGHDLDAETDPVSAGLEFAISKARREAGGFPGAERILELLADGAPTRRVGLSLEGRMAAREGAPVFAGDKPSRHASPRAASRPRSATRSRWLTSTPRMPPTAPQLEIEVRGKRLPARVVPMPFVPHRYHRKGAA